VIRTFLTLCIISAVFLVVAFLMGTLIDDPKVATREVQRWVQYHFLAALTALMFATLVHAIVLTYFMGTGRWLEETSLAYKLSPEFHAESQRLKSRTTFAMLFAFLMLLATGALGAAADPGSAVRFQGGLGLTPAQWHFTVATITLIVNLAVNSAEFQAITRNGELVEAVLSEVRRIRTEKGLAV